MQKIGALLLMIGMMLIVVMTEPNFLGLMFAPETPLPMKASLFCITIGAALMLWSASKQMLGKKAK